MKTKLFIFLLIFSLQYSFGQSNSNCYQQDNGLYQYYAKLDHISVVNPSFNKSDFMSYAAQYSNISSGNMTLLNSDIVSVSTSFPGITLVFFQNVVSIDAQSDLYSIISNSNGSISKIECRNNAFLLGTHDLNLKSSDISVTENPITNASILKMEPGIKNFELSITSSIGRIIYKNRHTSNETIYPSRMITDKGIYFITILDTDKGQLHTLKVVKA